MAKAMPSSGDQIKRLRKEIAALRRAKNRVQSRGASRLKRGDRVRRRSRVAGHVHRFIPEERIQNAGQAAGQRDDGDVLAPARGDAQGPGRERRGRGRPAAKRAPSCLVWLAT